MAHKMAFDLPVTDEPPKPETPLYVHCQKCEREWFVCWLPLPAGTVVAVLKAQRCACGSKKLFMNKRPKPTAEGDPMAWLRNGDTGISSETIWSVMMGRAPGPRFEPYHPLDPSDFGRCYRLLQVMPSWRARLSEGAAAYPSWAGLIEHWDQLTELYERALKTPKVPATEMYDLMKRLTGRARA